MTRIQVIAAVVTLGGAGLAGCSRDMTGGPRLTEPDAATHTLLYFPVSTGSPHDLARLTALQAADPTGATGVRTCDGCHADRSDPALVPPPPAITFRTFTCTGCHVTIGSGVLHDDIVALGNLAAHAGFTAFDASTPAVYDVACRNCHPRGVGVDHQPIFPLPHQNAAGTIVAACADCHTAPTDRRVLGCAGCHPHSDAPTTAGHAAVPGFSATDSALCARCHGDSTIPVAVATGHTGFPITSSSTHLGVQCLGCHQSSRPAPKAFAADFTAYTCTGCHVTLTAANGAMHDDGTALAAFHAAANVTDFTFTDAACRKCHPDGAGGAPADHPLLFPIGAGTKHTGIGCADCHGAVRTDVTQLKCVSCHADPSKTTPAHTTTSATILAFMTPPPPASCTPPAFTPTNAQCLQCHPLSQMTPVSSHPATRDTFGTGRHARGGCWTCHVSNTQVTSAASGVSYTATDFSRPASPSQSTTGCATCHSFGCGDN